LCLNTREILTRNRKPRNARSKRALEKREPKAVENPKTALFLRGTTCSQVVQDAMGELHSLRQPLAKKFTKKNAIHPFEDASSLEFFSEKNDASILVFGSTSKKRPNALTFTRTFGHKILDILELYLDADSFRTLAQFKTKKFGVGLKPMILFAGTPFESPVPNEYTLAKSVFTDFFKGAPTDKVDVEGLQYLVAICAEELAGEGEAKPPIHLRVYGIRTQRSGHRLPRVEVEEIGPRMDFRVGRVQAADESMMKAALKRAKTTEERTKKNVSTDTMGDKIGRIHVGKQDLNQLQTRKVKALKKRRRDESDEEEFRGLSEDDSKRSRTA
jgi:ribosome production factor 2